MKGCAPGLALNERLNATQKWAIKVESKIERHRWKITLSLDHLSCRRRFSLRQLLHQCTALNKAFGVVAKFKLYSN